MDISTLAPMIAGWLGIQPSTLLMLMIVVPATARVIGRIIPDDATGFPGYVRRICAVIGVDVGNRITAGVTTDAAALAAARTPPINEKVEAETGHDPAAPSTK